MGIRRGQMNWILKINEVATVVGWYQSRELRRSHISDLITDDAFVQTPNKSMLRNLAIRKNKCHLRAVRPRKQLLSTEHLQTRYDGAQNHALVCS
jgi:hypothetical protein